MTDVITVVDSTLATQAQSTTVVEVGYIAQTVSSSGGNAATTVTDETTYGTAKAVGTATSYAREDHTHGSGALGITGSTAAAGNHGHTGVYPPVARQVIAGTGLTGGGDLTADRALATSYGTIAGTSTQGNDSRLADARPYPLSGYGLLAASTDPMMVQGSSGIGGNTIWATRVWIPAGTVITKLWAAVRTAGTWDAVTTPNQLGLYDDTGTKVDNTPDDGTLWAGTGWRGGSIGTPVAAQTIGRFVYVLALVRGITGLNVAFPSSPNDANAGYCSTGPAGGNRRAMYVGATALPASFAPGSYGTSTGYLMLIGIS